jgi:dihydrofolate synthase/folylpolyglutamate synthase
MTKPQSLADWLALLEKRHPVEIDLGLERTAQVFDRLCLSLPAGRVITVAGTNGKGSCIAVMERLLCDAGISVGAYTSPHLVRYNERIRINGIEVSDEAVCQAFEQIEEARGEISLTYFEFGTLAALLVMAAAGVDVMLLEVGLGGRLDAVNVVNAEIAIVTSIALDHEAWLGSDLNGIAAEKSAIARRGKPLIFGAAEPLEGMVNTVAQIGAELQCAEKDFFYDLPDDIRLPRPSVLCALQALKLLEPEVFSAVDANALSSIALPGRMQQASYQGVNIILDVAHNPAAAGHLAENIKSRTSGAVFAVVGVMKDKDINGVIAPLRDCVKGWYPVLIPDQPRSAGVSEWQPVLDQTPVMDTVVQGVESALAASSRGDTVLVFGSFFTVAPAIEWLRDKGVNV